MLETVSHLSLTQHKLM